MSNPKLRRSEFGRLLKLRQRSNTGEFVRWQMSSPKGNESCRWERIDGHWVTLSVCDDQALGKVLVEDSTGRRELVDSYEDALLLARSWRD